MPVVMQLLEAWCEYRRCISATSSERRERTDGLPCADPVQVVTAYKFFHPTVSRALIISGKKAVVE
jgi:hypothetical protein